MLNRTAAGADKQNMETTPLLRIVDGGSDLSFDTALAGAANLLEMVGGGKLIVDPRMFPVTVADQDLSLESIGDGHWPHDSAGGGHEPLDAA